MLGFCETCRDEIRYSIRGKNIEKCIKGKQVFYKCEIAICNECGNEMFIGEIRDRNLEKLEEAYNGYHDFMPSVAIAPGETIKENIVYLGIDEDMLAKDLEIKLEELTNILEGSDPINEELAIKLEKVIGPSKDFWLNLQKNYESNKIRLKE